MVSEISIEPVKIGSRTNWVLVQSDWVLVQSEMFLGGKIVVRTAS